MDVSNLPTATSTFFQASKALDLDDSVYQPPNYPFAVFDDALFNNVQFGHSMRDANFAFGSMNYLSKANLVSFAATRIKLIYPAIILIVTI